MPCGFGEKYAIKFEPLFIQQKNTGFHVQKGLLIEKLHGLLRVGGNGFQKVRFFSP